MYTSTSSIAESTAARWEKADRHAMSRPFRANGFLLSVLQSALVGSAPWMQLFKKTQSSERLKETWRSETKLTNHSRRLILACTYPLVVLLVVNHIYLRVRLLLRYGLSTYRFAYIYYCCYGTCKPFYRDCIGSASSEQRLSHHQHFWRQATGRALSGGTLGGPTK